MIFSNVVLQSDLMKAQMGFNTNPAPLLLSTNRLTSNVDHDPSLILRKKTEENQKIRKTYSQQQSTPSSRINHAVETAEEHQLISGEQETILSLPKIATNSFINNPDLKARGQQSKSNQQFGDLYGIIDSEKNIQHIKDSIASAYLQKESSLSPFIQTYFKQTLNIKTNQQNTQAVNQIRTSEQSETSGKIKIPRPTLVHQQRAQSQMGSRPQKNPATIPGTAQSIRQNVGSSPSIQKQFLRDKLARMQDLSGDALIEKELEIMRKNISSAQTNRSQISNSHSKTTVNQHQQQQQQDLSAFANQTFRKTTSSAVESNPRTNTRVINLNTHEGDSDYSRTPSRRQNTAPAGTNRRKISSDQTTHHNLNTEESCNSPSNNNTSRPKSRQDLSFQALLNMPQNTNRSNNLMTLASHAKNASQNADPNFDLLKTYYQVTSNVNLNNLFVNSIGISDQEKQKIIAKMCPDTRQGVEETLAINDVLFKLSKSTMKERVDFQKTFDNNRQFVEDPELDMNIRIGKVTPKLQREYHSQQRQIEDINPAEDQKKKRNEEEQMKITAERFNQTFTGFQTNRNSKRQELHLYQLLCPNKAVKKEFPLYINRVNRIRDGIIEEANLKRKKIKSTHFSQTARTDFATTLPTTMGDSPKKNSTVNLVDHSLIDPRKVYRQNLEIISNKYKRRKQKISYQSSPTKQSEDENSILIKKDTKGIHPSLIYSDLDIKGKLIQQGSP